MRALADRYDVDAEYGKKAGQPGMTRRAVHYWIMPIYTDRVMSPNTEGDPLMTNLIRTTTYSAPQVAEILGVHRHTVRAMVARGELEEVIVGPGARGKRITRASVEAYAARFTGAAGDQRTA